MLERSLTVQSQGAGIVLGRWSLGFFEMFDKTKTEIAVPAIKRQFFNRDGSIMMEEKIELGMTSWDKVCGFSRGSVSFAYTKSSFITPFAPISTATLKKVTLRKRLRLLIQMISHTISWGTLSSPILMMPRKRRLILPTATWAGRKVTFRQIFLSVPKEPLHPLERRTFQDCQEHILDIWRSGACKTRAIICTALN